MFRMNTASLRVTLEQLQQAANDHFDWRERLTRTIVCKLPADPDDLANDAHRRCRFGQWYYEKAAAELNEILGAIVGEHRRVHEVAACMLNAQARGERVTPEHYDEYLAACDRLRNELDTLRQEIHDILGSCDALTGAYGRARLLPDLRQWRELVLRKLQSCCVIFMDVDHLKTLNDVHGHTTGDQVLAGMIEYVTSHLRPYDRVYRYGGDEFVISLPATDLAQAEHLVQRIRAGMADVAFVVAADGRPIHATASFGIARLDPDVSAEESVDRADRALLLAKTRGRDRAASWEPGISTGTILAFTRDGRIANG